MDLAYAARCRALRPTKNWTRFCGGRFSGGHMTVMVYKTFLFPAAFEGNFIAIEGTIE